MKLYRTANGFCVEHAGQHYVCPFSSLAELIVNDNPEAFLEHAIRGAETAEDPLQHLERLLPPIDAQEVWAAGVTYFRSRSARMEEAKASGGGNFYDRVYTAERPELFFKATPGRVVGHGQKVAIRKDATWSVPEPELTLVVNSRGKIIGYTIGNDMSSRDIEGENPLYLPQAKVYDRSCALGPGILVTSNPLPASTKIRLEIRRGGEGSFCGETDLTQMKRNPQQLVEFLYRENTFTNGAFLLTGTGVVPPDSFTLSHGDEIRISIDGIGTLINVVG